MSVDEASVAEGLLEDMSEESAGGDGQEWGDGADMAKKVLLSTEPHEPPKVTDEYLQKTGLSRAGAYAWRGVRKSLNGLGLSLGLGGSIFKSALFDYCRALYALASGGRDSGQPETPDVEGGQAGPDMGSFDLSEPEVPGAE